jgi:hypothetical protein
MVVYKCGNWDDDEEPEAYSTIAITCEGWYDD